MKKIDKIINFMRVLEEVCIVKRDLLLFEGTTENDAMHIFKLSFLVMLIAPYLQRPINYTRMLEMALVHDIVEGKTGDYTVANQLTNPNLKKEKKLKEAKAIKELKDILPTPVDKKIYQLYQDYEQKKSREAKIVSVLDKLEANLQANQYQNGNVRYWEKCENGSQYYKIVLQKKKLVEEIEEPIITELEKAIIKLSKENMIKCKIEKNRIRHAAIC